ncbi:unnamed protein product [Ambrosiozyma monospora]|uniref:Unnamed protein product n=1 Tax=Ambrosiozyma monospora TaxID=43982 RepID=A0A9W6YTT7_AMBMO|nr:unnamed protein product [Ambrosiozyma monospora]
MKVTKSFISTIMKRDTITVWVPSTEKYFGVTILFMKVSMSFLGAGLELTDEGISQTNKNHALIAELIDDGLPLTRCADTSAYTWRENGLDGMAPVFKEKLREPLNPGTPKDIKGILR